MHIFIFARFHAREGQDEALAEALRDVLGPTRGEPGCLAIGHYRSIRDPRLFHVHSRWVDEAAFEMHARLPHTVRFLERVQGLIDHTLDVARAAYWRPGRRYGPLLLTRVRHPRPARQGASARQGSAAFRNFAARRQVSRLNLKRSGNCGIALPRDELPPNDPFELRSLRYF
jgi:quinol monooxygenase YgiN